MAGVRPLTEEEKELISLYGKPITVYDILQAFSQDKGVKHHLMSSHALFDFNFRLSENGHPNFDVSVKPDAFTNGVLTYDLEEHNRVNTYLYRSKSRMRGQRGVPKGRKCCKIFEKYSEDVPRDKANEISHVNGDNIPSSLARTRLSGQTSDIQTKTQPEIGRSSKAKEPRAIGRKRLNPQRVGAERTDIRSRQFYHSQTLQPMTLEEVLSDADSDNEDDQEFKDFQERMKIDRLVDASDEEKRFMWLWNTFIRKQRVYADKHVPWACEEFVKLHAKELITPKLLWQWRMFAVDTLCLKYGLICAKTMDKCSTRKSARTQKKKKQEAASSSKANANGNEPQPMELDEEQH
ncbi:BnaA05g08350D [Brassica napus]|uniref:BnaA05g08350D protein n=1 Tax=Brassica napus TaxID=3708 RepID=A0A078H2G9_BRANA|nr:BnaA05g08350D [Brassica napus]